MQQSMFQPLEASMHCKHALGGGKPPEWWEGNSEKSGAWNSEQQFKYIRETAHAILVLCIWMHERHGEGANPF